MESSPAGLSPGLPETTAHFREAANELIAVYNARKPAKSNQVTPQQLAEAVEQLLTIITKLDKEEGEAGPILRDNVTQLGEYGLSLLLDLMTWATQLGRQRARGELENATLGITDWILRREGRIQTLEPIVNALAGRANILRDSQALEQLAAFMSRVIDKTAEVIKQDLEKGNPGRPWRLLNLNRAIVATRSHNTALMERTFDELVRYFPEEASGFFAQGMAQMATLNFPQSVREVMSRYHTRYDNGRSGNKLH